MHLISLETQNFKKLGNFSCQFTDGLNVIAGENFAGKSTLLQAIEAALFGVTVVPGKAENIPTWGQQNFGITLTFRAVDGHTYQVTRNKSTAKLTQLDGDKPELKANGSTPVKAKIEEILEFGTGKGPADYNLFIQSRQGESSGILTFGATALSRKVEEFAGADVIDKVQQAAQTRATRLTARAETGMPAEGLADKAHQAAREAEAVVEQADAALKVASKALEDHGSFAGTAPEGSVTALRDEQRAAERLLGRLELAEKQLPPAQARAKTAAEAFSACSLKDLSEEKAKLEDMQGEGTKAAARLAELTQRKQDHEGLEKAVQRTALAVEQVQANKVEPVPAGAHDENDRKLEALEAEREQAVTELAAAKAKHQGIRQLAEGAACPTCGHVKGDHDPAQLAIEQEDARVAMETLQDRVKALAVDVEKLRLKDLAFTKQALAVQTWQQALDKATAEHDAAVQALRDHAAVDPSELADAEGLVQAMRDQYATQQAEIKQLDKANDDYRAKEKAATEARLDLENVEQAVKALDAEYAALPEPPTDEQIQKLEADQAAFRQAQDEHQAKANELSMAVFQAKTQLEHANKGLDIARDYASSLDKAVEQAEEDLRQAKRCERLVRFLREGRQGYLKQVWDHILGISSTLVTSASSGAITAIANDNGEFLFEEEGVLAPATSASGAQRSFMGTSLRVGLTRALYGSDSLLIFDEPTESCNERNAGGMAAMLATSAKQVLLITHRENDQALAQNIINVGA